jgi:autotransporter-associated beta strand protein
MKACIYQAQTPVDIPQAETRTLKDVLELPWGLEIYSLLSRWNPLNLRRPLPAPASGRKVLVVGTGPAGFTLAHHLMNDGHTVVAIDGLKIEPLEPSLSGVDPHGARVPFAPVREIDSLHEALDSRTISGFGGVAKQGATTLTLSGVNTYSGATTVEEGKLVVNGSVASSAVTVQSGAILGGGGTIGSLTLNGILAPGNSAGTTTANGNTFWNQGSSYDWEIFNLAGPAGTGWDLLSVTGGTLDLTGITGPGGFTINLITLQGDNNTQGALTGFDPATNYATGWMIASASSISGFNASEFNINKNLFVSGSGTFAIEQRAISGGQGLFVTYTGGGSEPIPEPGTWAAAALLAGAAGYVRWRRRKEQAKDA